MREPAERNNDRLPQESPAKRSPEEVMALYSRIEFLRQENVALHQESLALRKELETQRQAFEATLVKMQEEINVLKRRLNTNSTNSGIPPSRDPIGFDRSADKDDGPKDGDGGGSPSAENPSPEKKRRRGGQKGHKGHRIKLYSTEDVRDVFPERCKCGCEDFDDPLLFHTHQVVELPSIPLDVLLLKLHFGVCRKCGARIKARLPKELSAGAGPNLTALIGVLAGTMDSSARQITEFLGSGLFRTRAGEIFTPSLGAVMNLRRRCSEALSPHRDAVGEVARSAPINHVDETSWPMFGPDGKRRHWLWVMVSGNAAFYLIHRRRSNEAFQELVGNWQGYLISDDYGLYRNWISDKRQSCLAHLIRAARKLSEDPEEGIAKWGRTLLGELRLLVEMDENPPTNGEWQCWKARMKKWFRKLKNRDDSLGTLVSRLERHFDSLYTFLRVPGVEPTNNSAERALRSAVVQRKKSFGSTDECGLRWTERVRTVLMTCRLNSWSFVDVLKDAVKRYLCKQPQDLSRYEELRRQAVEASAQLGLVPATP